ncbi:hypothetical protein AB0D42_32040 [Streptomyces sp. NPDC048304]
MLLRAKGPLRLFADKIVPETASFPFHPRWDAVIGRKVAENPLGAGV